MFPSHQEAWEHPLIQIGDVVMGSPSDIRRFYNLLYIGDLLAKMEDEDLRQHVSQDLESAKTHAELDRVYSTWAEHIWKRLKVVSGVPPSDPGEVWNLIVSDRLRYNDGIKERKMNDKTAAAAATGAATGAAEKPKAAPRAPKFAPEGKITFLKDKEGNLFGPDNNPKREGSAAHARFKMYKNGMTVKDFLEAGGKATDLDWDVKKEFVKVA